MLSMQLFNKCAEGGTQGPVESEGEEDASGRGCVCVCVMLPTWASYVLFYWQRPSEGPEAGSPGQLLPCCPDEGRVA